MKRKGEERQAEAAAEQIVRGWLRAHPPEPVTDPIGSLLSLAADMRGWYAFCRSSLDEMSAAGRPTEKEALTAVILFERAAERLQKILADVARLNLDERLVALSERQSEAVEAAIVAVVDHLGADLSADERAEAMGVAASRLRSLAS